MHDASAVVAKLQELGIADMVRAQCLHTWGVRAEDVCGKSRTRHIVAARDWLWAYLRERYGWSFPAIGTFTCFDPTAVMAGVRRHEARVRAEQQQGERQ